MGRCLVAFALLGANACNAHLGDPNQHVLSADGGNPSPDGTAATMVDAVIPLGPWGTPAVIPGADDATNNEDDPTLSSDGLELYYAVAAPMGDKNLYLMSRASRADAFGTPVILSAFNTVNSDEGPRLSYDDLTIYFGQNGDIFTATRATKASPWGTISVVPGVSTAVYEKWLSVCGDNSHFVVSRLNGANGQDLYEGTLGTGAGTLIANLSSTAAETSTFLSKDCLTLYFASNRGAIGTQIYISTRAAIGDAWGAPVLAPAPFDTGTDNEDAGYTPDNRLFVFASTRAGNGTKDLFLSTR
jgi:Tol biopolymer transport system component